MKNLLFIVTLLIGYAGFSQVVDEPFDKRVLGKKVGFSRAIKQIKHGDIDYERGGDEDMEHALKHYIVADSFHSKSAYLNYRMGVCYLYSNQKFKAGKHLRFVKEVAGENIENYPDLDFHLARSKHLDGDFDDAIVLFRTYKEKLGESDANMKFFINKKIQECKVGKELKANPVRVWVDNLGPAINTKYPDFGPVISADNRELYFTSRRPEGNVGKEKDETGYHYEDIYSSTRSFGTEWGKAKNIGKSVNTKSHDATVGIAPDGKSLITYHGISRKDGNLLMTKRDDSGKWEKLKDIGVTINTKYHEEAATLSFDEKKLFFVSDKPGGTGGHDIYIADWDEEKNTWGEPRNIGTKVNTEFDEKGVFFHPDNKSLYFSSAGHRTMGGLDIFKTEYDAETDEWSDPVNIGYPINTPDDDVYFVVSGDERYAYYSSFREGGYGEKDIYQLTFLGEKKNPLFANSGLVNGDIEFPKDEITDTYIKKDLVIVKGHVKNAKTGEPVISAITFRDASSNETLYEIQPDENGFYILVVESGKNYAITSIKQGYTMASDNLVVRSEDEGKEYTIDFEVEQLEEGAEFTLRNIYFDFDKSSLRHASVNELNNLLKIMQENPTLRVGLTGHTDSRGSNWYNSSLSKRRSKVAKNYLVKKGIAANRIETKGMGAKVLEISDTTINGMSTVREKEEAHQKNRRTMVTILNK